MIDTAVVIRAWVDHQRPQMPRATAVVSRMMTAPPPQPDAAAEYTIRDAMDEFQACLAASGDRSRPVLLAAYRLAALLHHCGADYAAGLYNRTVLQGIDPDERNHHWEMVEVALAQHETGQCMPAIVALARYHRHFARLHGLTDPLTLTTGIYLTYAVRRCGDQDVAAEVLHLLCPHLRPDIPDPLARDAITTALAIAANTSPHTCGAFHHREHRIRGRSSEKGRPFIPR